MPGREASSSLVQEQVADSILTDCTLKLGSSLLSGALALRLRIGGLAAAAGPRDFHHVAKVRLEFRTLQIVRPDAIVGLGLVGADFLAGACYCGRRRRILPSHRVLEDVVIGIDALHDTAGDRDGRGLNARRGLVSTRRGLLRRQRCRQSGGQADDARDISQIHDFTLNHCTRARIGRVVQ